MLHVGRAGAPGFGIATSEPLRVADLIRHRLAATASLTAIAVAAGPGEAAAAGLPDSSGPASDANASIETAEVQPDLVPVGSDATHAYFLDTPADDGAIARRIGAAFSGDRDAGSDAGTAERPAADGQTYALTAGQRILNAFGAAPDPLSVGPKWGPYIDFIARPGTPTSTGTIDLFVPVAQADDWLVFLNARGTLTSEPSQEAGLGGGVRHIVPDFMFGQDTILGVYGFVDFRNSSNGNSFVQGTIGAELITERFEVRINGYLPGSRTYTVAGSTRAGVALQGTNVVLTNTLRQEQALPGFDVEAGLRFELDPDTILRVNGGYYRFARGGTKIEGGLARAELQFDDPFGFDGASLSIGGELRNDNYNGTHGNATVRFRMPLGTSRNGGDEGAGFGDINDLMVRPVQRFDNVVAPEVDGPTQEAGPATDAATGQTLQVFHVAQTAQGTGDCSSVQNACTFTVAQSLAGAGDTFLAVDIAGDIASAFALNAANQRVVGAGDTGTVNVPLTDALNSVLTLGGLGGRPTVAGVDFGANADPFVRGIATNGAAGIGGNGFTGTATIDDVRSTNGGLSFQNTGAAINVTNSAFNGGAGIGVALTNLTGAFTMTGSTVTSTGGGFRIDGGNGAISHDGAVTQTGAASAIDVRNRTGGTVTFGGPVTANTGTATGINLQNNAGTIAFNGGLDIDTTTGTGFSATGGGTVNVSNGAVANSVNATAGQAIDIDGVGGSLTFSTIASTGAPGDAVAIDNFGAGATFRVTGATAITTPGEDGIDINNTAGTVTFAGPVTIATPTDDGVDMDDVTGMVSFSGPVTVTNPGDDGIDIEDSFNATLAFNGPVAITGAGGNGIELNGPGGAAPTTGTLTFGGSTTITNPTLAGVLAVDRIGAVTFADLDIALQTNGSAGLVLANSTINGNFTATDFDVTSTTNAGTAGVVLSGTTGPGTIQLGDANVAGASASIAGVDVGVVFNAASNATFIFGDGESPTDQGSAITATTAIQGGSLVTTGSYDFDDVVFTGALDFTAGGGGNFVFVSSAGGGTGNTVNDPTDIATADLNMVANTTFVLINDGAAIDDVNGFTLHNNQTMASFGNGRTFASGGLIIPGNFSGVPGAGAVITDPTGNGAAVLTNTGAGDTLTALGGVTTQDFIIENTAGGDGLAGAGAIGITSTGLTIRNISGGQGIDLDNATGTVTFNDTRVATTAGNGVDITSSTVSFTGVLDIDTAAGIGLNATGGSTLSVAATASDQSITSTAGTALNLDTVTIGAGGVNFDTVSSTNAGNGNAGIGLNALTGAGGVTITNATVVDSGGAGGGNGIELANVGMTGALTIANIDIDMPVTGGNNLRGINSTGGHTADINLGTGAGGVAIDDTAIGIQLTGTAGTINIGTGAGSGGVQLNTLGQGINIGNNATGTINIGTTAATSAIDAGNAFANSAGIALNQADATVTVTGIDINGAGTGAAGHGIHVLDNDAVGTFTLNGTNTIDNTGGDGIRIDGGNAMISGVTIGAAATGVGDDITGNGVNVLDNGQNISASIDTVTVADARGAGIRVDGSGAGSVTINSFNNNTVTDADVRGVDTLDATFDAVTGGAVQQVTGGNLSVGTIGDRVEGDGVRLDQVLGDIGFGTVDIFNNNGTGLFIRDAAGKAGAFAFGNTGGTIDTTNGASVDIDPVTMSSTFASLTSTNSAGRGVNLDTIAGTFTVTGTTSVTGSTTEGVRVINSTAAVNLGTLNVSGTTGTAVLITNNGGGSFTATGGTVTKAGAGDALDINGGAMAVNFGANISHTSNGGDAVSIRGGTTGSITVSGTIANSGGGRPVDIDTVTGGTVSFTGATVTSNAGGIQIANVAAGANVAFSGGTTVTIDASPVPGIDLSANQGAIAFNGTVDINNARGGGVALANANANVTFATLDIEMSSAAAGANQDAISIGGTPGTLTFGVTTITNVGAAANQKGIDLSGTTLGGAVNFQSVAISGPDTSTSSVGIDLTGVLGTRTVNMGTVGVADSTTDTPSSITDLHRGVVIDNTAAVQFTFGDGFGDGAPGGPDEASTINVNGQAGAFTVDVGGGTNAASSFDFNDVAFGAGDNANLPAAAGSVVFVSQTGGMIAAGTHNLSLTSGANLATITVADAELLPDNDQTFVFVAHTGAGTIDVTGGGADGFTLKDGQSLDGFDDDRQINFGTTVPLDLEGDFTGTGGIVEQDTVIASNSNAGATSIVATAAGAGNSTIRNTVFDATGLGAGDAAISVDGAANAVTINNVEITNVGTGATAVLLNDNSGEVTLNDVDLFGANAGMALGIDAGGASTAAITVDAASDIDGTTGTVVSIGAGTRNVTVNTNIAATGNTDNVIEIASQSGGAILFGTVTSANATGNSVIETTAQSGGSLTFGNVAITGYGNAAADVAVELFGSGGTVTFADLDIATVNGAGLAATGAGLTIAATSGDINVTGGAAVNLDRVTANTVSLTSITGNGSGTVADGVVLNNLGANSTFAVTGTTTLDNYADAGIQIANLANNNQDIDFAATDINRNTAVATGRGIVIENIGGTGVDIDFGTTQVGQGTVTTMGILVSGVGVGATGFRTDFESVNISRARTGISIDNVDGGGVGVTNAARADNAEIANLTVQGSDANVTFGGTFGAQNTSGVNGRLVSIGNAVANTGTTTFVGQATITASGTAAGEGVNLGGGTATFNGGLNIDTVTGTGLTATGGTLNVAMTGGDESITTTSGRAVQIQNTTINAVFDSITGNGGGTAANGISFVATGGGSSFAVTGTTTLNNYTAESIILDTILSAGQTFAFGAVDINTTAGQVQAGSDGISISTISAPGVNIAFGAVTVGNATDQSDDGIRIRSILAGANDIDIDFASLALTNLDEALHIENFDATGRTITVAGTTTIDDARTHGIRIFNAIGNVTFGDRTTILNDAAGANASGVDLGTSAGGANAGAYTFNGVDITVNGVGAFGFRAINSGTVTVTGANNTINTTTGQLVNLANVAIGGAGIDFTTLAASGSVAGGNAISIDTVTGGTFTGGVVTVAGTAAGDAVRIASSSANTALTSFDIDNTSGDGIELNGNSGTFTVTGLTDINNPGGTGVSIQDNSGAYTFGNVTINNRNGAGIAGNANGGGAQTGIFGTVTINNQNNSNTSAFAIDNMVTAGSTLTVASTVINVGGTSAAGLAFSNNDGATITINGGAITNVGATGFGASVSSSTGSFTYAGTITNTAGNSVRVTNNAAGGTTTFSGAIDDSGSGVTVTNNTGHTVDFTGGLTLNTGTNAAFTATGGGTVTVQGPGNSVTSTTGTAVNISGGTTIGGAGVTFQSVSANGVTNGIVLNNTGAGAFTVTGTGTTDGSGGTIQNTTGSSILLTNVQNVALSNMNITDSLLHGIQGTTVTNLDLTNVTISGSGNALNEHGILITNLLGTGASSSNFHDTEVLNSDGDTAIVILQTTPAVTGELLIDGTSRIEDALEGGFEARTQAANAALTVTIGNTSAVGVGETVIIDNANVGAGFFAEQGTITATVRNSIVRNGGGIGSITRGGSGTAGVNFVGITGQSTPGGGQTAAIDLTVTGNDIDHDDGGAGGTGRSGVALGGNGNVNGNISNNTIDSNDEFVDGIFVNFTGVGTTSDNRILIDNNTINMTGSGANQTIGGIEINASDSTGGLSVTITNNTINSAGANGFSGGIVAVAGDTGGGDNNTLCVDIRNNNASAPAALTAGGGDDYSLISFSGTTFQIEGLPVGAVTEAQIQNYIVANDDPGATTITDGAGAATTGDVIGRAVGTGSTVGVASCP